MKDQYDLFFSEPYKIKKKIRLIELFGGIGAQAKALENLGVDFEHYRLCEFDKYAVASYNAVHHTDFVTNDITKIHAEDLGIVDTNNYDYIMCYSFPCQDLSLAGLTKGMKKGSSTRSGLLWEVERLLKECNELPQVLVMENVTQVHNQKNSKDFEEWCKFLNSLGYMNYYEDLNSKDFEIPQNRDRTIMVSILGNYSYEFPKKKELKLKLKDLLESEVDEKYFLSDKMKVYLNKKIDQGWKKSITTDKNDIATCVCNPSRNQINDTYIEDCKAPTKRAEECLQKVIENDNPTEFPCCCDSTINDPHIREISNCITSRYNAGIQNQKQIGLCVIENCNKDKSNSVIRKYGLFDKDGKTRQAGSVYDENGLAPTLDTMQGGYHQPCIETKNNQYKKIFPNLRIRKLTPKECWRLMGFDDVDFDNAAKVNSNAQLYKQAGNSIVVNVLMAVFKQLL